MEAVPLPHHEASASLSAPYMLALVMSQLQPLLDSFNHSLHHLSLQVGGLAQDVAQLKAGQVERQTGSPERTEHDEAAAERLDAKLKEVSQHIREVKGDMEIRLHSQHAMLHYNLTNFKMDVDLKLKRHQKMLQVGAWRGKVSVLFCST